MSFITDIRQDPVNGGYAIWIDGQFCCRVRERTFPAMGLQIGSEISCPQLIQRDNFHWKHSYGSASWAQENSRLKRAYDLIAWADHRVTVTTIGFGANSTEFIPEHATVPGFPDLAVHITDTGVLVARIEVTGTEQRRGPDLWVRPDKIAYAQTHPEENPWIVLHYAEPKQTMFCVKPDPNLEYHHQEIPIRGSIEHYVIFQTDRPEIHDVYQFRDLLVQAVNDALAG